jgi:hypothetical protein
MVPSSWLVRLLALVALVPSPAWAGRKFDVSTTGDLCSTVCEFRLCVTAGDRPRLRPCKEALPAEPAIVVRTTENFLKLRLRGTQARLLCYGLGAPCVPTPCASDDECGRGLSCLQHPAGCAMATTCPGAGWYPGIAGDTKTEVNTPSDPCSALCEFRLCLSTDGRLLPCAPGETPDVAIRAPRPAAHPGHRPFGSLVLKHERERLTLKCEPVGAPCFPCATAAECFTGASCSDGACRATALCQ